ncbi:hypothetical protein [Tenacibaculum piscium]|uniref:Uncharacterized protein n=1 Tax=Tenacibaculum piscium TaxID=1458515 RepID=A0A2H1YIJ9_9FLAO|nr:hypothetical protein [Tenacibaculum piscium]MBE7628546.1 hypothetical protein [Tenacibaculum piscium]MBE7669687.1 hypothetical protein [Tenacibaculum piscium]MBE7684725.1 hypothetical protein [Tenacibaculum piscium]MBE7689345.1 hypothetical protein [Tenacibaculum piscium]SOS75336.1 conserved hypothetical protein [Tenacibaculum piscium]
MKTIKIIIVLILLNSNAIFGQKKDTLSIDNNNLTKVTKSNPLFKPNYPEGIFLSKKDFINKKANSSKSIELRNFKKKSIDSIIHNPYFYYSETNKKVKNVFAVSYKGHLYFQVKAILKNRNKTDRAQITRLQNTFVRVIIGGNNYLYTEAELVNKWAMGTTINFGIIGGVIGNDLIKGKGIVWDFKNKEFNIFKSCKDYNKFIENKLPSEVQKCRKHQPDMFKVRKAIEKII